MENLTKTVLIQGFDRSGTTAISRLLGTGTNVEMFMQPFNSGPIRKRMYEIWDNDLADQADKDFFKKMENNELDTTYIKSHWFDKHSTTKKYVSGHIHFIKSTINHFTTAWINLEYPKIDQWAIWRDPMEVLASLCRNDFVSAWYGDAIESITPTVHKESSLFVFLPFLGKLDTEIKKAAFLIAVRSYFLFLHLDEKRVIEYAKFIDNPELALSDITLAYGLENLDYSEAKTNHNLIGKNYAPNVDHIKLIQGSDLQFSIDIFKPLNQLVKERHHVS